MIVPIDKIMHSYDLSIPIGRLFCNSVPLFKPNPSKLIGSQVQSNVHIYKQRASHFKHFRVTNEYTHAFSISLFLCISFFITEFIQLSEPFQFVGVFISIHVYSSLDC